MKKKLYRLHRQLSIIIAIPVLLWASSGFMHPLMTNIRPAIATQGWPAVAVDSSRMRVSLVEVLRMHHLDSFANVRLVHIDTNWFYQVVPARRGAAAMGTGMGAVALSPAVQPMVPIYLSCTNGNVLPAGDWLYAQYLARHFLEGGDVGGHAAGAGVSVVAAPAAGAARIIAAPVHVVLASAHVVPAETVPDCCGAATECVLNPARGAKVANVSLLNGYDNEYKSINRLLPVYRVSFDRPDGIRIYVETTQDRFSFAMDNRRAVFDEIFRLFHTWGWLDGFGKGRIVVELSFALLAFFTVLLGVVLFFSTRAAKAKSNPLVRTRRYHRYTAIFASLFTLFWSFSGGYHAFTKLVTSEDVVEPVPANFAAAGAGFDYSRLRAAAVRPITNLSLARIGGNVYWRVSLQSAKSLQSSKTDGKKDLMKDVKVAFAPVVYVNA
ncbi:MAG TPA: PepSY domain-containing protein, partial [Puia sp.]|nr:PepSY domain-containing protein [Puia sp.]